jgi:hypothetical protein
MVGAYAFSGDRTNVRLIVRYIYIAERGGQRYARTAGRNQAEGSCARVYGAKDGALAGRPDLIIIWSLKTSILGFSRPSTDSITPKLRALPRSITTAR